MKGGKIIKSGETASRCNVTCSKLQYKMKFAIETLKIAETPKIILVTEVMK